jgi:hypothetical protein
MRRTVVIFGLLLLAAVCFGKLKVEFDKKADFTRYKTYQWYPPRVLMKTGVVEDDDVVAPLIRKAVNRELTRRNMTEVKTGGDLKISSWALSTTVPNIDAIVFPGEGAHPGPPVPDPAIVFGGTAVVVGRYNKEGTVVVNLIDSATSKSAWAGLMTQSYSGPSELEAKINKAVDKMFDKYPIKAQ